MSLLPSPPSGPLGHRPAKNAASTAASPAASTAAKPRVSTPVDKPVDNPADSPAHDPRARVPRILLLARLLWRCAFCIFAVVAGNAVLMAVPQAREALRASLTPTASAALTSTHLGFVAAMLYWAVSAWLVTRLLLSRKFSNDGLGATAADRPYLNWLAAVLPRVLAFLALLPVSLLTLQINRTLGAITLACAGLVIVLLVMRTRFGGVAENNSYGAFAFMGPDSRQAVWGLMALSLSLLGGLWALHIGQGLTALWMLGAVGLRRWDHHRVWPALSATQSAAMQRQAQRQWLVSAISLLAGAAVLALMLVSADAVALARHLSAPAILLLAMGSWTLFGGFVLTYVPLTWRWIGLATWLPPLLLLVFSGRETHFVAQRGTDAHAVVCAHTGRVSNDWRACRLTAVERFARWVQQVPNGEPVYMAAAVGGASRAAVWTGDVLAQLEDQARLHHRRFAANLFAISGISGGSLGATAFVAALAQYPDTPSFMQGVTPKPEAGTGTGIQADTCLADRLTHFLRADFLSPVVARMLFPDLAIRFVPVPQAWAALADRSLGLELAWAQDWRAQSAQAAHRVAWDQPINQLYDLAESPDTPHLPSLLLNTVRLEDGQRFIQSNVKPAWPGVMDLLDTQLDTQRLTLAQAVHNSARFPYVSPGALLLGTAGPALQANAGPAPHLGHLGDGGYHESSGAASLADLLEALLAAGQLRAETNHHSVTRLWACAGGWAAAPVGAVATDRPAAPDWTACKQPSPVVALILDSGPASFPADHVRDLDGRMLDTRNGIALDPMVLPETLGPVFGGLSTRTQLSTQSQHRLSRLVGSTPSALIELRMPLWRLAADPVSLATACAGHLAQPSMNWKLDDCSLARMHMAAGSAPAFGPRPTLAEMALQRNHLLLRQWVGIPAPAPGPVGSTVGSTAVKP